MNICKLLIADPSDVFRDALSSMLEGVCDIRSCRDGVQALTCLEEFQPDVLVTELVLPGFDGISFLKKLCAHPSRPAIVLATYFISAYVEKAIGELDIDYVVMKPCDLRSLAERVRELGMEPGTAVHPSVRAEQAVTGLLLELSLSPKCGGFRCLETAIALYSQDPGQSMTKELYPEVARLCGGSGRSVEKAIRAAIHSAWDRRDERQWRQFFRPDRSGTVPRPTNTQFITTMAECLRRRQRSSAG